MKKALPKSDCVISDCTFTVNPPKGKVTLAHSDAIIALARAAEVNAQALKAMADTLRGPQINTSPLITINPKES